MYEPVACLLTLGLSMLDTKGISLVLRSFHVSVSVSVFCLFSFLSLGPCSSISFRGSSTPSLVRIPRSVRVLLGGSYSTEDKGPEPQEPEGWRCPNKGSRGSKRERAHLRKKKFETRAEEGEEPSKFEGRSLPLEAGTRGNPGPWIQARYVDSLLRERGERECTGVYRSAREDRNQQDVAVRNY